MCNKTRFPSTGEREDEHRDDDEVMWARLEESVDRSQSSQLLRRAHRARSVFWKRFAVDSKECVWPFGNKVIIEIVDKIVRVKFHNRDKDRRLSGIFAFFKIICSRNKWKLCFEKF